MQKRSSAFRVISLILSGITSLVFGVLVGVAGIKGGLSIPLIYCALLVSIIIAVFLQTAIHEAGHLCFGLLTGYDFLSYRVGSLVLTKENGKLRLASYYLPGTLGQCLMGPPADRSKRPYFLYNAGGVIFNILTSLILLPFALKAASPFIRIFLLTVIMYGLIMFFSNAIPTDATGVANDGMNILELKDHPDSIDTFYNMLGMNKLLADGARPSQLDEGLLDLRQTTLHSGSIGAFNAAQKVGILIDRHDFEEARMLIDQIFLEKLPLSANQLLSLRLEKKYLDCLKGVNEPVTDKKLKRFVEAGRSNSPSIIRYLYARALLENDREAAQKLQESFMKLEKTYPFKGEYQSEKELMEVAEQILKPTSAAE